MMMGDAIVKRSGSRLFNVSNEKGLVLSGNVADRVAISPAKS